VPRAAPGMPPPARDREGTLAGGSCPDPHAAQPLAAWGMLAVVVAAGRSARVRVLLARPRPGWQPWPRAWASSAWGPAG